MGRDTSIEELWRNWEKNKSDDNTNQLIENYMYLVQYHVQRIASNLPKSVNKDDIKSLGLYGLYDALLKFDSTRDLKFDTYASIRIKGAIIDGLRKEDWLPRSTREKVKRIDHATELLEQRFQREISSEDIAEYLDLSQEEVEEVIKDSFFANLLSMEEKGSNDEFKEGIGYSIPDEKELTPEANIVKQENMQLVYTAMEQLSENEQFVLSLFYDKELTFTEIGKVLKLTTSRISQIHKQAIFKLRQMVSH
ncbi:RNA polymerase sigma factor for flagellar operon FliA [Gracilibacillus ureilyticus]|uniref:RNA polymerase sigma factor for flagellar operon FliA n=1 Tax=Gracilibacillus ureilyticus TaxID=531814 RepID=A0A1H9L790_9BACI|nr:FliA/WhiG family RNA polymerase sigma factor [Gracilibacillus ureilyticus]SER07027.1 RNA polymerase sigma factor for flagellar operon FliA [Gracilibacillus ureilyticus]